MQDAAQKCPPFTLICTVDAVKAKSNICTEQWFVGVDAPTKREGKPLRQLALSAVEPGGAGVKFVPEWGRNRMRGMLESLSDKNVASIKDYKPEWTSR